MGKRTTKLLEPSDAIGEYSIGADLVKYDPDPEYVQRGIISLRKRALKLCKSEKEDDQAGLRDTNRYFTQNDKRAANRDLWLSLDQPLSNDIVGWLAMASDEDALALCTWSLGRTAQLTRSLHRDRNRLVGHTLDKTEQLVDIGLFPRFALPVVEAATDRYHVQGMDAFHSGGGQRIGFCSDTTIGMANLYKNRDAMTRPSFEMKRVMLHEYLHGAGHDRGFFWGISTRLPVLRIMEEAFVEHATVVAHSNVFKRPETIHPFRRPTLFQTSTGVYIPERTFLATVCAQGDIPVEDLGVAYFSPRNDERGEQVRESIEMKIGRLFGDREGFFEFVDAYENAQKTSRKKLVYDTIRNLPIAPAPEAEEACYNEA